MDWGRPFRAIGRGAHRYWHGGGEKTPWIRRTLAVIFAFLVPIPILLILIFRFVPLPGTPEMLVNLVTLNPVHYSWRSFEEIAPTLPQAVVGSEDQDFCFHHGFDWKEIDQAIKQHERHPRKKLRGASTISQQAARSLFLTPVRSWVRKGMEAYLTVLIEALWPKKRILTAYLNVVDFGHGNFGAEAAAENYFGRPASALTPAQSARLAAILPDPDVWKAVAPGPYVAGRTETVLARMGEVRRDGLDWCTKR
ncbi:MAG TPA: monofunctional biosynthetic peptidoglycan transglycosylase [Rhizomicrobium sp.]|jgi:monofunctional biosynthetic peptidoglycan transglycosylase|nr:monofunctional biosynthetic peptidoglycan transglycosylase [Rhizomicrobium sp.]